MLKRILQINATANWGSTGKIAEQIGLKIIAQGWESFIAYGRMSNPSKSTLIKVGSKKNVYLHYARGRLFDNEGLNSKKATKYFLSEIDRIQPDIIHLHNIHDHFMNYLMLFDYLSKKHIPVVWTQHDEWAMTGHCYYIPDTCNKWKNECHHCPIQSIFSFDYSQRNFNLKKKLFSNLQTLLIIPVSDWLGQKFKLSHLKNRPIHVIHNGIDLNAFKPQSHDIHQVYGLNGKKIILGVASIWSERKGINDFYKLASLLPKDEFAIILVGKVFEKRHITGINECDIIYVEQTNSVKELASLYTSAFVFVNPTYKDNYPTTNLESMACGTPVITYNTGGSPESVDNKTGIVVEQGDIHTIAQSILKMRLNPLSSKDCRQRAEILFDMNKCFEEYINIYKTIFEKTDSK